MNGLAQHHYTAARSTHGRHSSRSSNGGATTHGRAHGGGRHHHRREPSILLSFDSDAAEDARKYDDFATVDWVRDTLLERARRQAESEQSRHADARLSLAGSLGSGFGEGSGGARAQRVSRWRRTLNKLLEAGQTWFVVTIVGLIIGVDAAFMSIITAWLSDLKLGVCSQGWWLNRKFCCWEMMDEATGACEDWHEWTHWSGVQWLVYVAFAGIFAFTCAWLVKSFAPYAAGSGISEIKCILTGFVINGFLSPAVLFIKSLCLPIAIASGLSVGKEGPSVHVACSVGHVVANWFTRFSRSQAKMRDVVTAASAAGVAVAFGSPIGGVLFSLEEMTINYPTKTMLRSFFCALVATVTLSAMNPFRTGKLVLFQVQYDRDWHFFEVGFFILIGIFGGLYGAFVIKYNLHVAAFRRKHLGNKAITEATFLALLTAAIGFVNKFIRIDMNECLDILFRECEDGGDYANLCQPWAQWRMVNSLLLATVIRTCLVVISYGCKVPAGIFVPSMAVGATFGRMVGILVKALYRAHPEWPLFAACQPGETCITPGTYAFLGAAAGLAGITRITVTVVVIMFELTGALTYILPTMIVVMVTKAVSDQFDKGGIADQMIRLNGYPLLENEDHAYNTSVGSIMRKDLAVLPATRLTLSDLREFLDLKAHKGFPVVDSHDNMTLLGDIARVDLVVALERAETTAPPDTECIFGADRKSGPDQLVINLSPYVNQTPLAVSPKQPLEVVMEMFRKMGPRVMFVEQYGELVGLISVKDILKYTIAHEASEHRATQRSNDELDVTLEDLWEGIRDGALTIWRKFIGITPQRDAQPLHLPTDDIAMEQEPRRSSTARMSEHRPRRERESTAGSQGSSSAWGAWDSEASTPMR